MTQDAPMPSPERARGDRRVAVWLAVFSALAYLPFNHCHFSASDETGVYETAQAILRTGGIAVEAGKHRFKGADGQIYSHFAFAQSLFSLPLVAAGNALTDALPAEAIRRVIGRESIGSVDTVENLPIFLTSAYAPLMTGLLIGLFYGFERRLGASRRAALLASALLGAGTYVATHSVYFLRHTSEAVAILAAFAALHAWRETGALRWLAAGSAFASLVVLIRVPAAVSGPALAGYLLWTLVERARRGERGDWGRIAAAVAVPALALAAVHLLQNHAKWEMWIGSPMLAQSFLLKGSLRTGLDGLLLSPGASIFAYSPLLLLLPFTLPGFWRSQRAECVTLLALAGSFLFLAATFRFWHGLWSSPGPRYLFVATPLLMLPLGPWLDRPRAPWLRGATWALAAAGLAVQIVLMTAHWRRTVERMDYQPQISQTEFLFEWGRSPIVGSAKTLLAGEVDVWWLTLWTGVPGREPQPGIALVALLVWAIAVGFAFRRLRAASR